MGNEEAPKISVSRLPSTVRDLFGREQELRQLDRAWADPGVHVLSLVAWGGVGKSALINHWLETLRQKHWDGAHRVYGWSFYRQGTSDRVVSADEFIASALVWFGDPDPTRGSPWDRGERLAILVKRQRTLLILDGLEPLQGSPQPIAGKLKDQALQALLRGLAVDNTGLCVITTRVPVADLEQYGSNTVRRIDLRHLNVRAGAKLLRSLGVRGQSAELAKAVEGCDGHCLALTLLGSYLRDAHNGDVRRWREVGFLKEDNRHGGHARRVMASYEAMFGEGPETAVLHLIGLFDRPAEGEPLAALRTAPIVQGLNDKLHDLTDTEWREVVSMLRSARLLDGPDAHFPDTLDTHPLVREYFGEQLKKKHSVAWREGHSRLYEYLKRVAKQFPATIEEMAPLYAAMYHGCQAGRHQDALVEVYRERILRKDEYFSSRKLGAYGADLAALSRFFDIPWRLPVASLSESNKAFVLFQAGSRLRALGRTAEAAQPTQSCLEVRIAQEDWKNAAGAAGNLSEIYLILGDLPQALAYAQKSVDLADQSGDRIQQMQQRVTLGDSLHQQWRLAEAEAVFHEAESIRNALPPEDRLLYSWSRYCDLLLDQEKYQEVLDWVKQRLARPSQAKSLLNEALDHLSLGKCYLLEARRESSRDYAQTAEHLRQAVEGLRRAGREDYVPSGLLVQAELCRVMQEFEAARSNIEEALAIATRGGMRLRLADCYLAYSRLHLALSEKFKARQSLDRAKDIIQKTGYHRRDREVADLETMLL